MYTVSITSQGQISIPAKVRRALGLRKKQKAKVSIEDGKMVVEPIKDFLELGGSLKTDKKPLSDEEMDEVIAEAFVEEYRKKLERSK